MQYAIGPVLYYWPKTELEQFYQQIQQSSAPIVYLGETVCNKRRDMKPNDWLDIAQTLAACGKQVVLSTQALLQAPSEIKVLKQYCDNGEFLVEANDIGAIDLLHERKLPFVCGSAINIYNAASLKLLLRQGMVRWVMPVELSRDWLSQLLAELPSDSRSQFEVEVFGYGHLPLAYSARCFTARSLNRSKDDCQECCQDYPSGRKVFSQEGQSVFVLNGIQTQSGQCYNLCNDQESMTGLVDILRISPSYQRTNAVLEQFNQAALGQRQPLGEDVNGYWHQLAGLEVVN
ncbi:U32 family peptidase [Celerinatantimonas yamalensis]|uniref:Ubiquinone biosynthesis protein UbiV n=1 Tax=Celerinatantimonas yamalensis TaxID=559956 RepID=A0ABW9G787_9GAMM